MSCEDFEVLSTVYIGHDNPVTIIPYSDISERVNYDMTDVTEVTASADLTSSTASGDDIEASSEDTPITITWGQVGDEWRINLKVGLFIGIAAGDYKLRVVIIEPSYPNGLVLTDDLLVTVVGAP
jgi:hypothetical protein